MPNQAEKLEKLVNEFGSEVFTSDGVNLSCEVCKKIVNSEKKYYVTQHVKTAMHHRNLERQSTDREVQAQPENSVSLSTRENPFYMGLCRMLVETNIPLFKVQHPSFRAWVQTEFDRDLPEHTTLRKTYLSKLYDEAIIRIRSEIGSSQIWVSVDETTDSKGQFVINTIVGVLKPMEPTKPFLLGTEVVEHTNHSTVAQAVINSLSNLWPDGLIHNRVMLLVTDAAAYMKKAGRALGVIFPRMIHVTCLAHAIHRVCDEIRCQFPEVDDLIANIKKVFLKAPSRVETFRRVAPSLPLPPEPVLTRWGTWLNAAVYYAENFEDIQRVATELNASEAATIRRSQEILLNANLKAQLAYIAANYSNLPRFIEQLECTSQKLTTTLEILENTRKCINAATGRQGALVKGKLKGVLEQNPGFKVMLRICEALQGQAASDEISEYSPAEISAFNFAPMVSVDVERSFSQYKNLLTDRRHALTPQNAKFHLISMCNFQKPE